MWVVRIEVLCLLVGIVQTKRSTKVPFREKKLSSTSIPKPMCNICNMTHIVQSYFSDSSSIGEYFCFFVCFLRAETLIDRNCAIIMIEISNRD